MYRWYRQAVVCYAYLSDVPPSRGPVPDLTAFSKSRWFSRGWCLQELIAPREVEFFAEDWTEIGTKDSLRLAITQATGIPDEVLCSPELTLSRSAAERMSWASKRQTSREEDMAYCLFGLFDVNLPLLYGEGGTKAFFRLQEEILRRTLDLSLLLWCDPSESQRLLPRTGALCEHPCYFAPGNLRTISGATFLYSKLPRVWQDPLADIGSSSDYKPPQIVGNHLKLSLMTIPYERHLQPGEAQSGTRLASIRPYLHSQFDRMLHVCILLGDSRIKIQPENSRVQYRFLELVPEVGSFAQEGAWEVEEILLRLHENALIFARTHAAVLGSALQLHISARCKVPHDELVVTEALVGGKPQAFERRCHPLGAHSLARGDNSFRQDNMISLDESTTLSPLSPYRNSKVAIRILVRSRVTSATKIAAVLVLYPFRSFRQHHWALRTWEVERPLDEEDFESHVLGHETGSEAGLLLDTSDRTLIWISSLGQCLEISRKMRPGKYFLQLVLSRCDWAGPYPAGAQELCL